MSTCDSFTKTIKQSVPMWARLTRHRITELVDQLAQTRDLHGSWSPMDQLEPRMMFSASSDHRALFDSAEDGNTTQPGLTQLTFLRAGSVGGAANSSRQLNVSSDSIRRRAALRASNRPVSSKQANQKKRHKRVNKHIKAKKRLAQTKEVAGGMAGQSFVALQSTSATDPIDFNQYTISNYANQHVNGTAVIEDNGATLRLTGNTWKTIDLGGYTFTPDSVLEFDFHSSVEGEVHAIGVDNDNTFNIATDGPHFLKLHGNQHVAFVSAPDYAPDAPGIKHYRIPIGLIVSGTYSRLVFAMDHDVASPTGESVFSNVRIYDDPTPPSNDPPGGGYDSLNFNNLPLETYQQQGNIGTAVVEDNGNRIRLTGDIWKSVNLGGYTLTPNTILEFDFESSRQGEIHGIGFDNNSTFTLDADSPHFFQIYGLQNGPFARWFDDYGSAAPGVKHYRIPVGQFINGNFARLVFVADHDVASPIAESVFSNVYLYEKSSINLAVDNLSEADEEITGGYVVINDDHDELNVGPNGAPRADNEADLVAGERIVVNDSDLLDAQLHLSGPSGQWKLTFPDTLRIWKQTAQGFTRVDSDVAYSSPGGSEVIQLKIEALESSGGLNDIEILATFTPPTGIAVNDTVRLTATGIDVDVDSDNDNGFDRPDYDREEERIEDDATQRGKLLHVNDTDADGDTVIDYVDFNTANKQFAKLSLLALPPFNPSTARFRITYDASDPANLSGGVPNPGTLRMWTKDADQSRSTTGVAGGGDYLAPGEYTGAQLGLSGGNRELLLYLEAIATTTDVTSRQIRIEVDPDGTGAADYILVDSVLVTVENPPQEPVTIKGRKWHDLNANGIRDTETVVGTPEKVVFILDVSGSTRDPFRGDPVGDVNSDGQANTILDSELAGFIRLNDALASLNLNNPSVSLVVFGRSAKVVDLDPTLNGTQMTSAPGPLIEQILHSIDIAHDGVGGHTNYEAALRETIRIVKEIDPAGGNVRAVFLSDGYPTYPDQSPQRYLDEVAILTGPELDVDIRAFGAGNGADLAHLKRLDGQARIYTVTDTLLPAIEGLADTETRFIEPTLGGWTVYVDINNNNQLDPEELPYSDVTEADGAYTISGLPPGQYIVREVTQAAWTQTAPSGNGHTVTLAEGQTAEDIDFGNVFTPTVDLDVDSDNNNGTNAPDRDAAEESIESNFGHPGKTLFVNPPGGSGVFTPMVLDLSQFNDLSAVTISFTYGASHPSASTPTGPLRIWTKDGPEPRTEADYIDAGATYSAADLGLSESTKIVTLYLEGVMPTASDADRLIRVDIDPDGNGPIDVEFHDEVLVTVEPLLIGTGTVSGQVFRDRNRNHFWDRELVKGDEPDVIMILDISGSTSFPFGGASVGDTNNDGLFDSILDAEIAGYIALNKQLIDLGFGSKANVSVIAFDHDAYVIDMDPSTPGSIEVSTRPTADIDGDGVLDVVEALSNLPIAGGTSFAPPLSNAVDLFRQLGTSAGSANVFFLSDGEGGGGFEASVQTLRGTEFEANLRAFGVGEGASLELLRQIDPQTFRFTSTDEILNVFGGLGTGEPPEDALEGWTVYVDVNQNGLLDAGEPTDVTDANGMYEFTGLAAGTHQVRVVRPDPQQWLQTTPFVEGTPIDANNSQPHIVQDLTDGSTIENLDFGVVENTDPPTATGVTVTGGPTFYERQPITVTVQNPQGYRGPNDDIPLRYSFDLNNDGDFIDEGEVYRSLSPSLTFTVDDGPEASSRQVRVRIHDAAGNTTGMTGGPADLVSDPISVLNAAPSVVIVGPQPQIDLADLPPNPDGRPLTFQLNAIVTDDSLADTAEGFDYAWSVSKNDQTFDTGSAPTDAATFALQPDGAGTYEITVVVTEKIDGGSDMATYTIEISDSAPSIVSVTPDHSPAVVTGFGLGGKVVTDVGEFGTGTSAVIQPDGKIIVVGEHNSHYALTRYHADGTLDTSFGSGGIATSSAGDPWHPTSVALLPDGKIAVAGLGLNGSRVMVASFNSDGSPNSSFAGGLVETDLYAMSSTHRVLAQSDGKLVVAGIYFGGEAGDQFALARYDTDGTLDDSFGTGGMVLVESLETVEFSLNYSLALQADGKIIVARADDGDVEIARYNTDGTPDTSFDGDGTTTTDLGTAVSIGSVFAQADGTILASAESGGTTNVVRYTAAGAVDTAFGNNGVLSLNATGHLALQPDGGFVIGGTSGEDFVLARFNANGAIDTSFGTNGVARTDFGGDDAARSILVQPDGKIILAGSRFLVNTYAIDFALARYNPNGSLDAGNAARLTVTATDDAGEQHLRYYWDVDRPDDVTNPTGVNGTNAGKTLDVTFLDDGVYNFTVYAVDDDGLYDQETITVTVQRRAASVTITPEQVVVQASGTHTFTAQVLDQFGDPIAAPSTVKWQVFGDNGAAQVGSIDPSTGVYTASINYGTDIVIMTMDALVATARVTVPDPASQPIVGEPSHYSITEGHSIDVNPAPGEGLAGFIDSVTGGVPGDYTATIDWGDGSAVETNAPIRTVDLGGGVMAFEVYSQNGHQYTQKGDYTLTVTLTHTASSRTQSVQGSVAVALAGLTYQGYVFNPIVGETFSGPVFRFASADATDVIGDFEADIDWGDGTVTTNVTIQTSATLPGYFDIVGTHAYATGGDKDVRIVLRKNGEGYFPVGQEPVTQINVRATTPANFPIEGAGSSLSVIEGQAFGAGLAEGEGIAVFVDALPGQNPDDYVATIDWHDGSSVQQATIGTRTITLADGSTAAALEIFGGHTYTVRGDYAPTVTLTHVASGRTFTVNAEVAVAPAPGSYQFLAFSPIEGQAFTGPVLSFTSEDTTDIAGDFTATINWGDSASTPATVALVSGEFHVSGTHTYASAGPQSVTITIHKNGSALFTATGSVNVLDLTPATNTIVGAGSTLTVREDQTFGDDQTAGRGLAGFFDPQATPSTQSSEYTALVTWNDGTTSNGVILPYTLADGVTRVWEVFADHAYADASSYVVNIGFEHTPTSRTASATANVTVVAHNASYQFAISRLAKDAPYNGPVLRFVTSGSDPASAFEATIDWGDGSTPQTVSVVESATVPGTYEVQGEHTYTSIGNKTVTVTVTRNSQPVFTALGAISVQSSDLTAPTITGGFVVSGSQLGVHWKKVPGALGYVVWVTNAQTNHRTRMPAGANQYLDGMPTAHDPQGSVFAVAEYLSPGTTYIFTVQTMFPDGSLSPESAPLEISTPGTTAVETPAGVEALHTEGINPSNGEQQYGVELSWQASNVSGYRVFRKDGSNWRDLTSDLTTPVANPDWESTVTFDPLATFIDPTTATNGRVVFFDPFDFGQSTSIEYVIVAYQLQSDPGDPLVTSQPVFKTATPDTQGPTRPVNVLAASYPQAVQVTWSDRPTEDDADWGGWYVYRWTGAGEPDRANPNNPAWALLNAIAIKETLGYNDFTAVVGAVNHYMVRASDALRNLSEPAFASARRAVNGAPSAPVVFGQSDGQDANNLARVLLTWDHITPIQHLGWAGDARKGYDIERRTANGSWVSVRTADDPQHGNDNSIQDTGLAFSTTYTYRVRTVDIDGDYSAWTELTVATGNGIAPEPPTGTIAANGSTGMSLQWTAAATGETAIGYRVYRSIKEDSGYRLLPAFTTPKNVTSFNDTGLASGTGYYYRVYAIDADGDLSAPLQLDASTDTVDEASPYIKVTSHAASDTPVTISADTVIRGIVDDPNNNLGAWRLVLVPMTTTGARDEIVIARGDAEIGQEPTIDEALGTIQPTLLEDGLYRLVLKANDVREGQPQADVTAEGALIQIKTDVKVGSFTLPVVDMEIDVPGGEPIVVRRVYDSGRAGEEGDFGYGWRLELSDTQLRSTARKGTYGDDQTPPLRSGDLVYFNVPGQGRQTFMFMPVPKNYDPRNPGGSYGAYFTYDPLFIAVDGSNSRIMAEWDPNDAQLVRDGDEFYIDVFSGNIGRYGYNPARAELGGIYTLETGDGASHIINAATGDLISSTDANDNKTNYNDDGAGSNGRTVHVQRDPATNRILWISTDPSGNGPRIDYTYDAAGNLVSVTDRTGRITEYAYEDPQRDHFLTGVLDARGVQTVKVAYDSFTGKVASVTDALGEATSDGAAVQHSGFDGEQGSSAVTDLEGNRTEQIYNSRGDVIREIREVRNASGEIEKYIVTVSEFNYLNNHYVDPLLFETSGLNKLTRQAQWQAFEITGSDPTGRRYTATPQSMGALMLREITYKLPDITKSGSKALAVAEGRHPDNWLPQHEYVRDADGQLRHTEYKNYKNGQPGWVKDHTTGVITESTFDDAGNIIQTKVYTEITGGGENILNRTQFKYTTGGSHTYADGTTVNYDGLPKGLLLETFQLRADGTPILASKNVYYTSEASARNRGRLKSTTDAAGLTSRFTYDDNGNVRETFREWTDAQGAFHSVRDSLTEYDAEGRVTRATDAYGRTTRTFYDELGQTLVTIDEFGGKTVNTYDVRGNLIRTLYPDGTETRSVYDDMGRVTFTTDRFASGSTCTFDESTGQVTWTSNDNSNTYVVTETIYDSLGRVVETRRYKDAAVAVSADTRITTAPGVTLFMSELTLPGAQIAQTKTYYDAQGRVVETVNAEGLRSGNIYYSNGQVHKTGPLKTTAPIAGGSDGTFTDADFQYTTEYQYDQLDDTERYDAVIDALGRETRTYKDAFGRQTRTVQLGDPGSGSEDDIIVQMQYDDLSRTVANADPLGRVTNYEYDNAGRLTAVVLPAVTIADPNPGANPGQTITVRPRYEYRYDAAGNQISTTTNAYLAADGVTVVYLRKNGTTGQAEIVRSRQITDPVTDATLAGTTTTRFTFDQFGRTLTRTLPLGEIAPGSGFVENFEYEPVHGQQTLHISFEGRVTRFVYDNSPGSGGRILREECWSTEAAYDANPETPEQTITYSYDELRRQDEVVDSLNGTWSYSYDPISSGITQEVSPQGAVNHAYDQSTGRLTRTWTDNTDTHYTYDAFGRLETVDTVMRGGQAVAEDPTAYHYDDVGNLDAIKQSNGVTTDYQYDAHNRLTQVDHFIDSDNDQQHDAVETLKASFVYQLDDAGNRTNSTETDDQGRTTAITWGYDSLNRLISEDFDSYDNTLDFKAEYAFDLTGNRLSKTVDQGRDTTIDETTTYTYDSNDRLLTEVKDIAGTTAGDTRTTYSYNETEQTGKTVNANTDGSGSLLEVHTFTFNHQGQLHAAEITKDGTTTRTRYAYNPSGIRISSDELDASGNVTSKTTFVIDANNHTGYAQVLEEWVDADGDGSGQRILSKTYTIGHDVIAQAAVAALTSTVTGVNFDAGEAATFLYDGHGSTRALFDTDAAIVERYDYDAYGDLLEGTGLTAANTLTNFLYTGEGRDATTSLYYLRARDYDPATGRFTIEDPFGGFLNDPQTLHKYLYTNANPIFYTDPLGLFSLTELLVSTSIISLMVAIELLPGPGDFIQSVTETLITAYSVNQEWDVGWAMKWNAPDNLYSRTDNRWITAAIGAGLYNAFDIFGFNPLDWFTGDEPSSTLSGASAFSATSLSTSSVSSSASVEGFRKAGRGPRFGGIRSAFAARLHLVTKTQQNVAVNLFSHPAFPGRHFVDFPQSAIKKQIRISPQGSRDADIRYANAFHGKEADYNWKTEYGEAYTWHHDVDRGVLQLVPRSIHDPWEIGNQLGIGPVWHIGGSSIWY